MAIHRDTPFAPDALTIGHIEHIPNFHLHSVRDIARNALTKVAFRFYMPRLYAFDGVEHIKIGDRLVTTLGFGTPSYVARVSGIDLSYGEVIALGGDWFSKFDSSDSTYTGSSVMMEDQTLCTATADDLLHIKKIFDSGLEATLNATTLKMVKPLGQKMMLNSAIYYTNEAAARHEEEERQKLLAAERKMHPAELRMFLLALTNWDHFHPHCLKRYAALHEKAKQLAKESAVTTLAPGMRPDPMDPSLANVEKFRRALALNAFADHFLSDAFSSGHTIINRNKRWVEATKAEKNTFVEDRDSKVRAIALGELLASRDAKSEHDLRCGGFPLYSDIFGKNIECYGDGSYAKAGKEQLSLIDAAMRNSVLQIYEAYLRAAVPKEVRVRPMVARETFMHDRGIESVFSVDWDMGVEDRLTPVVPLDDLTRDPASYVPHYYVWSDPPNRSFLDSMANVGPQVHVKSCCIDNDPPQLVKL